MDGSGFAGNECPPDLDLSEIADQVVSIGQTLTLDLVAMGATATDTDADEQPTGDQITWQLDPDIPTDTPTGATITHNGVFTWTPSADQVGTHTIIVIAMDEGSPPLADAETFTVTVVDNQVPTLDLNGSASGTDFDASYTEGQNPTLVVDTDLAVTDPDDSNLASARIEMTERPDGTAEALSVDTSGTSITSSFNESTGVLTLTSTDTLANYQQVLRTLRYVNSSDVPTEGPRDIEISVNDGTADSDTAVSTVTVVPVNDAPDMDPIEDEPAASIGQALTITVTADDPEGDTLTFQFDPQSSPPEGASIEKVSDTTAEITWTPQESHGAGPFTFRVVVTDDGTPAQSDLEEFTVTLAVETAAASVVTIDGDPLPSLDNPDTAVGQIAPEFSTVTPAGESVTVSHDGAAKVIGFFAHWCPHCQAEVPRVVDWLSQNSLPGGVEVVAVSTAVDGTRANYPPSAWFETEAWPFDVFVDTAGSEIATAYGLAGFPFWVAVDGDGTVLARSAGELTQQEFADLVDLAADS